MFVTSTPIRTGVDRNNRTIASYADLGVSRVLFGAPDKADAQQRFTDRHQHLIDQFAT